MGITGLNARMILTEHLHKPIRGNVVTIGRQTVGITGERLDTLLQEFGIPKRREVEYDIDNKTVGASKETSCITQESFFAAFTDAKVMSLDVSDYEQAEIVHDLQDPLPSKYKGAADFIYNGSCLDNIFDPAAAIRNITHLLKPNGRVYHFEQCNSHATAYLKFSADWFMDYYAMNQFEDCKTYIVNYPHSLGVPLTNPKGLKPWRPTEHRLEIYSYNPLVETPDGDGYDCSSVEVFGRYEVHCIAEKNANSTSDQRPIQKHYRTDKVQKSICIDSARRFLSSPRPLFSASLPFDPSKIERIDSSAFPEQMKLVSVF